MLEQELSWDEEEENIQKINKKDILIIIRSYLNDTDFYHFLVTCKSLYYRFDLFAEQTDIRAGRWLGAKLEPKHLKYICRHKHVKKYGEMKEKYSRYPGFAAYLEKAAICGYPIVGPLTSNSSAWDLGKVANEQVLKYIFQEVNTAIRNPRIRDPFIILKEFFCGACTRGKLRIIDKILTIMDSRIHVNHMINSGLPYAFEHKRWEAVDFLLKKGAVDLCRIRYSVIDKHRIPGSTLCVCKKTWSQH